MYCNTIYCIVTARAVGCWNVSRHTAATRPAKPRHGVEARVAGALGAQMGVRGAQAGTGARGSQATWALGQQARGLAAGRRRALPGRGLGVLLGQQAVHSVHSACFGEKFFEKKKIFEKKNQIK